MTPLLIFMGIPTNVAVATSANQIVASSISGTIGHWRQGLVDFKMGGVLLIGSVFGSILGIWIFGIALKPPEAAATMATVISSACAEQHARMKSVRPSQINRPVKPGTFWPRIMRTAFGLAMTNSLAS